MSVPNIPVELLDDGRLVVGGVEFPNHSEALTALDVATRTVRHVVLERDRAFRMEQLTRDIESFRAAGRTVIEYGGSFYLLHETDTLTQFLGGKREFGGFSFTPFITRVPVGTVDRTVRSSHGRLIHRFRGGDFTACGKYIGVEGCWADGPVSCRACLKLEAA